MRAIDRATKRGNQYRIEYRLVGIFLWEYDILPKVSEENDDYLGMTFGWVRAILPRAAMQNFLPYYSEWKDDQNEKRKREADNA